MFSLNKAQIIGNATRDPEVRYTPNGQTVASFGVATNRRWKNQNGEFQEDTQFHDIVVWGKLAETIGQIVKKGNKIYVEGRLQTRNWEAPDGTKRNKTEIVMEDFVLLTPKPGSGASVSEMPAPSTPEEPVASVAEESEPKKEKEEAKGKTEKKEEAEEINLDDIPF